MIERHEKMQAVISGISFEGVTPTGLMWGQIDMAYALATELSTGGVERVSALDVLDSLAVAGLQLTPAQPLDPVPSDHAAGTMISAAYFEAIRMAQEGWEINEDRWWMEDNDAE
jgi:hypothetical protein